jgi:hypothetical protein
VPNSGYYPGNFLERLKKITKNFSMESLFTFLGLNLGPRDYETGVRGTRPQCGVPQL